MNAKFTKIRKISTSFNQVINIFLRPDSNHTPIIVLLYFQKLLGHGNVSELFLKYQKVFQGKCKPIFFMLHGNGLKSISKFSRRPS